MKRLVLLLTLVTLSSCVASKTAPDFRDKYPYLIRTYRHYYHEQLFTRCFYCYPRRR